MSEGGVTTNLHGILIGNIGLILIGLAVFSCAVPDLCVASAECNIKDISSSDGHVLILLSNGTVWAWGYNYDGACGQTIYESSDNYEKNFYPSPMMVEGISNITAVSAGNGFSIALKDDGTVWAWGYNSDGVLGLDQQELTSSDLVKVNKPTMILGLSNIVAIDASSQSYALALKDDGTVWAWGSNRFGQLGDGITSTVNDTYVTTPIQVTGLSGVKSIYSGTSNCFVLKNDGTVWAWGENSILLCDMNRDNREKTYVISTPGQVPSLTNIQSLAVGDYHALGLKDDGTVWAWGLDYDGSLGIGDLGSAYASTDVPVQVSGLSNIVDIGASTHSVALDNNGVVWTWGLNKKGQLGDGTTTSRNTPVQMHVPKATMIDTSSGNTFTVSINGDIHGSGDNQGDQLGARKCIDEYIVTPVSINFDVGPTQSEQPANNTVVTSVVTDQPIVSEQTQSSPTKQTTSTPASSSLLSRGNSILIIIVILFTIVALGFIVYLVVRK